MHAAISRVVTCITRGAAGIDSEDPEEVSQVKPEGETGTVDEAGDDDPSAAAPKDEHARDQAEERSSDEDRVAGQFRERRRAEEPRVVARIDCPFHQPRQGRDQEWECQHGVQHGSYGVAAPEEEGERGQPHEESEPRENWNKLFAGHGLRLRQCDDN